MPPSLDLLDVGVGDIHRRYGEGALTPLDLVELSLSRVGRLDLDTASGPPFNAILRVADSVRRDAAAAGAAIAARGVRGALDGIPVWIKDNIAVAGLPTTCGCLALDGHGASEDAALVRRLRGAGAIIMGTTGMTELGVGAASSQAYSTMSGRIGNAFDPASSPGGSSSGSAVAVSLNFGLLAVGVDDCGSIAIPAALNGCVGLRPTVGSVARSGLFAFSATDTAPGPLATSVADAAVMHDVLTERDCRGDGGGDRGPHGPPPGAIRLGVLAGIGDRVTVREIPPCIGARFAARLTELDDAGVSLARDLRLDGVRLARFSLLEYYNAQIAALRGRSAPPRTPRQLYADARTAPHCRRLGRHPFIRYGAPVRVPDVLAWSRRRVLRDNQRAVRRLMADAGVDLLVTATTPLASMLSTVAQLPHLTLPAGMVESDDEMARMFAVERGSAMPWGVSLLAAPDDDRRLLAAGLTIERILGRRPRPPALAEANGRPSMAFDIEAFNARKRRLALRSAPLLRMDDAATRYLHPTPEEFRALVRGLDA